jgi:LmbE family N-acetylglucosaminyl deacetylase
MIAFSSFSNVKRLLCIGAHHDDIEIGAGATILRIVRESPDVEVTWCVFSGNQIRHDEARLSAERFLQNSAKSLVLTSIPDSDFPEHRREIKQIFAERLKRTNPDLIFTHSREDQHQDHRVVNELTWNAFRANQIWEYEIPKWDGDLTRPNLYVPAKEEDVSTKIAALLETFESQTNKHWFDGETFLGLMRLRGLESNSRYAEAFVARKFVVA